MCGLTSILQNHTAQQAVADITGTLRNQLFHVNDSRQFRTEESIRQLSTVGVMQMSAEMYYPRSSKFVLVLASFASLCALLTTSRPRPDHFRLFDSGTFARATELVRLFGRRVIHVLFGRR